VALCPQRSRLIFLTVKANLCIAIAVSLSFAGDFEPETDSLPGDKNVKNPNNILAVPVWVAGEGEGMMGRILGVLMLFNRLTGQHELQHHFSEGDVNFAQSLSRVLSLQLQNATMFSSMNDSIHSIRKLLASETNVWKVNPKTKSLNQ